MRSGAGGPGSNGKPCHDLQRRGSVYRQKKEKEKTVAVRVCADCFKSLQSVVTLKQCRYATGPIHPFTFYNTSPSPRIKITFGPTTIATPSTSVVFGGLGSPLHALFLVFCLIFRVVLTDHCGLDTGGGWGTMLVMVLR